MKPLHAIFGIVLATCWSLATTGCRDADLLNSNDAIPASVKISRRARAALVEVRSAIARRDLLDAGAKLQASRQTLREANDAAEIERVWLIYRFVIQFWSAVRETNATLQPGSIIVWSDGMAKVESVERHQIVLQLPDQNPLEMTRAQGRMNGQLAIALARTTLTRSGPIADQMVTAFHCLDRDGDIQQARNLCDRMDSHGIDVDLWLPELNHGETESPGGG